MARSALCAHPFLFGATLVAATLSAGQALAQDASDGSIAVVSTSVGAAELVERYAKQTGRLVSVDRQVEQVQIELAEPGRISREALLGLLDFHDVVLVEDATLVRAHHRRNVAQKEGPPWLPLVRGDQPLPDHERLMTAVIPIRHGAGNSIFATVRGLLTRDTNRIGNILYVPGSEVVIIVDLTSKVAYYREVIAALDQPAQRTPGHRVEVSLFEVPRTAWRRLSGLDSATVLPKLRQADVAKLVVEGSVVAEEGRFRFERGLDESGPNPFAVRIAAGTPSAADAAAGAKEGPVVVGGRLVRGVVLELVVSSKDLREHAAVPLPSSYPAPGTLVFAFPGRGGDAATQLVLILETREDR